MIWLIVLPVIAAPVAFLRLRKDPWAPKFETVGFTFLSAFMALAVAMLIALVFTINFAQYEEQTANPVPIVAMADATHTEGNFYLFGGSVDSTPVYRYYYETEQGYRMGWKPAADSYIVESDDERPRYEKVTEKTENSFWYLSDSRDPTYIFYVPPGTVTNSFNLDLEG